MHSSGRDMIGRLSIGDSKFYLQTLGITEDMMRLASENESFLGGDKEKEEETEEQRQTRLIEEIREKKEVIEKLRSQPWNMHRKIHTLRLAQQYLEKHEAKVSKGHLYKEEMARKWKKFKRWMANISIYLIPWEAKIKKIESHFGSVVSSYFTFVRWIFWVNLMMSLFTILFIVVPEVVTDMSATAERRERLKGRKVVAPEHEPTKNLLQTMWDFEGAIRTSPLFYGFYGDDKCVGYIEYKLPLAYFLVYIVVLGYSFFAILRKMAENARRSKMTASKQEHYSFSWKVFTMWDYTIGSGETATNTVAANNTKLKEVIGEYKARIEEKFNCLRLAARIFANLCIMCMIAGSTYMVYLVVQRSSADNMPVDAGSFRRNEVPIVVSLITLFFPNFFEIIGKMERYHPRTSLRVQLARILALYLLNFYTLIFALFKEISTRTAETTAAPNVTEVAVRLIRSVILPDTDNSTDETFNFFNDTARDLLPSLGSVATIAGLLLFPNSTQLLTNGSSSMTTPSPTFGAVISLNQSATGSYDYYNYYGGEHSRTVRQTNEPTTDKTVTFTEFVPDVGNITFANLRASITPNLTKNQIDKLQSTESFVVTTTSVPTTIGTTAEHIDSRDQFTIGIGNEATSVSPIDQTTLKSAPRPWVIAWDRPSATATEFPSNTTEEKNITTPPPIPTSKLAQTQNTRPKSECWETYVGQEICRLITMDLVMTVASVVIIDFIRGLVVRFCNPWWCWNLETYFPEYGEFKVAENVLHIVNNQGMIWLGLFFSPVLPAVNNVKLIIILYLRSWACTTCNVPNQQVFRASRSNNFYLMLLLLMLFLCTLPVAYVIASQRPSLSCGPFTGKERFYNIITDTLKDSLGPSAYKVLDYVASPGIVIPFLLLMLLIIYFLVSFSQALKESNEDLKNQLHMERTEEKRKIFAIAGGVTHSGTREKSEEPTMPTLKKVSINHLPDLEKKRRETWHHKGNYDVHVTLPLYDPKGKDRGEEGEILTDSEEETPAASPVQPVKRTNRHQGNEVNLITPKLSSPALMVVTEEGAALADIPPIDARSPAATPYHSIRHSDDNLELPKFNGYNNNLRGLSPTLQPSPFPDMRFESPSSCDTLDDRSELNLSPEVLEKMMQPIERRYFIPAREDSSAEPLLLSTSDSEAGMADLPSATDDHKWTHKPAEMFENFGFESSSDAERRKIPTSVGGLKPSGFTSWPKPRENVPPAVKAAGRKFNFRPDRNGRTSSASDTSSPSSSRPFARNFHEAARGDRPPLQADIDSSMDTSDHMVDSGEISTSSLAPLTRNQLRSAANQQENFSSESTV